MFQKNKVTNALYSFVTKLIYPLIEPTHQATTHVAITSLLSICFAVRNQVGVDATALFAMMRSKAGMRVFNAIQESYGMSVDVLPFKSRKKFGSKG